MQILDFMDWKDDLRNRESFTRNSTMVRSYKSQYGRSSSRKIRLRDDAIRRKGIETIDRDVFSGA